MAFVTSGLAVLRSSKPRINNNRIFLESKLRQFPHNNFAQSRFYSVKTSNCTFSNKRFDNIFPKRYTTSSFEDNKKEGKETEEEIEDYQQDSGLVKKRFEDEEVKDELEEEEEEDEEQKKQHMEEVAIEVKELEEAEKTIKTSTPWTILPTTSAKKSIRLSDIIKEKRFYLQTVFDEEPDPLIWHPPLEKGTLNEKIVLLIKDYKMDEAKNLMKKANQAGRPYEEWMYTLMMYQYARNNLILEAKGLFVDAIKNERFPVSSQLYHALMYAYCLNRDIEGAQYLLEQMRVNKIEITQKTYELFLSFKNPVFQYVEELIRVMEKTDNLEPSAYILSHLIDSYRRNYDPNRAIETFHSIPKRKRDLNCIHAIMNVYFDQLEVAKAEYYFRQTLEENSPYKATQKTWRQYLNFYEKHGDYKATDALVDRMRDHGYLVTAEVYNSIIRSRFNGENYHYAVQAYDELLANHKRPNEDTYAAVLDSLVASDQLDRAREILELSKKKIGFTYQYRKNLITSYQPKIKFSMRPPRVG